MTMALLLAVLSLGAFISASWLTRRLLRYALAHDILDQVTPRSLHERPVPRGGGASVVLVGLLSFATAALLGFPASWAVALSAGGGAVGLVGWIDDRGHVNARWRLAVHFAAAVVAVYFIGPSRLGSRLPAPLDWPLLWWLASVVGLVWMINLFNFMDGIDGFAGCEATYFAVAAAALLFLTGHGFPYAVPLILLASAVLGFLRWNWPPAQIFMGDASSGFLGFSLGAFILVGNRIDPKLGIAFLILVALFAADATVTLLRRAARRERIYEAHRAHAYQHLARLAGAHLPITLAAVGLNVVVLTPIAWLAASGKLSPHWALAAAYSILVLAVLLAGAGQRER